MTITLPVPPADLNLNDGEMLRCLAHIKNTVKEGNGSTIGRRLTEWLTEQGLIKHFRHATKEHLEHWVGSDVYSDTYIITKAGADLLEAYPPPPSPKELRERAESAHMEPPRPWPRTTGQSMNATMVFCSACQQTYDFATGHLCPNPPPPMTPQERLDYLRATVINDHKSLRLFVLDVADVLLEAISKIKP